MLIINEIKEIIEEEAINHLLEIAAVKRPKNVKRMSLSTFIDFMKKLGKEIARPTGDILSAYQEIALDLKKNWSPDMWDKFTEEDKKMFLRMTYPTSTYDDSIDMLISSFTSPVARKVIFDDIMLSVERVQEAEKKIKPAKPVVTPESPYWKEFLEEIIKEETINYLKRK